MIDETHYHDKERQIRRMIVQKGPFAGKEITHPDTPEKVTDASKVVEMVEKHRRAKGKVIYEVGFGGLFCANLDSFDLSVGVDPMMSNRVSSRGLESKMYSERLFFNQPVSELPRGVYPDVILMVAPSPEMVDVIFDELESKIGKNTRIALFIENQSRQAVQGSALEIAADARDRFSRLGKKVELNTEAAGLEDEFSEYLNSVGLTAGGELRTTPWEGSGDWMVVTAV